MKLTIIEKQWYDKFRQAGLDEFSSNQLARFKYLSDEFDKSFSEEATNKFEQLINQDGSFYQFCIGSGRLTSGEINAISYKISHMLQGCQNNPFDNPFSNRYNLLEALWIYFKNIFNN